MLHHDIKDEAAKAIGLIIFEFSQLEVNIDFCIICSSNGINREQLIKKFNQKNFTTKLEFIEKLATKTFNQKPKELNKYIDWLKDTKKIRDFRNRLAHGRYGFNPNNGSIANVIGIPTSIASSETTYTINELNNIVDNINKLSARLNAMRIECPI